MADLIDYTVIVTVHYRLLLLHLCRGGAKRVFERPDKSWLRRRRGGRCGSHDRRRRQRSRRCGYWRFLASRHMNTVRQRRGLMGHVIHSIQCRRRIVWRRRCHVRSHRTGQRTRGRRTARTIRAWLMLLLLLRRGLLMLLMLLLLLMVNGTGDRSGRAAHYRGCVLTRMNGTRRHGGQV